DVQPFLYMQRSLPVEEPHNGLAVRPWRADDLPETARLLARAYAATPDARCFAPGGRLDEWAAYPAQLGRTPACGNWAADQRFVHPSGPQNDQVRAVLGATRLSQETSHVAQVAVDPPLRKQGVAGTLLNLSGWRAALSGASRQTLLVAETNTAAR